MTDVDFVLWYRAELRKLGPLGDFLLLLIPRKLVEMAAIIDSLGQREE